MIISLLVTGYVVYLYFKLKAERDAKDASRLDGTAELKSALFNLDERVEDLEKYLAALSRSKENPPC